MNLTQQRDAALAEANALKRADGTFENDEARAKFDAAMVRAESLDAQIRAAAPAPVDEAAVRAAATAEERERVTGIQLAVRAAKIDPEKGAKMIKDGLSLDKARAAILNELVAAQEETETRNISLGDDPKDTMLARAENWLLRKSGVADTVAAASKTTVGDPGEFRGMTLVEIARHMLEKSGVKTRGMDKMAIAGAAFVTRANITQTTSDFSILLENTTNKTLLAAYAVAADTWRKFAKKGSATDFRAQNRYRLGSFGTLDTVPEAAEYKNKAIPDGEKSTLTIATKGNIINWSRQMIVNDDMGVFTSLSAMLGRAAARSVEADVYALLAQNAGLGPTMSDGLTLFHATHGNIGAGSALGVAGIAADTVLMGSQKEPGSNDYIDVKPNVLLVPLGLRGDALVLNEAQYDVSQSNKFMVPNQVRGFFAEVVGSPRITGTRRYLFANPNEAPVLEVAFLDGQETPVIETQDGWRVDGTEMKVRLDYGVAAVDFRGAVTNAGV